MRSLLRKIAKKTIFPDGKVVRILAGTAKGMRYRISHATQLAPIYGGPEVYVRKALEQMVSPGDVVYDLGANAGIVSMVLSKLTGPTGQVHAFEPFPENVQELRENTSMNGLENVQIIPCAVGAEPGKIFFEKGENPCTGSVVEGAAQDQHLEIESITLDDYVFDREHPGPVLIKMDVEGSEAKVLEGAQKTFDQFQPLLIGELHTPEQDRLVGSFLKARGYTAYRFGHGLIRSMESGWPDPEGMQGIFAAFPKTFKMTEVLKKILS